MINNWQKVRIPKPFTSSDIYSFKGDDLHTSTVQTPDPHVTSNLITVLNYTQQLRNKLADLCDPYVAGLCVCAQDLQDPEVKLATTNTPSM